MPVISRDEIKEGYVNTRGVPHDQLPPDTNGIVSDIFFELVTLCLARNISIIIEAAFQHRVWESRLPGISELASPLIVLCLVSDEVAARRHLQRGLEDPKREFYHGDKRVAEYRKTGVVPPVESHAAPQLDAPTLHVSTDGEYVPSIDEIVAQAEAIQYRPRRLE